MAPGIGGSVLPVGSWPTMDGCTVGRRGFFSLRAPASAPPDGQITLDYSNELNPPRPPFAKGGYWFSGMNIFDAVPAGSATSNGVAPLMPVQSSHPPLYPISPWIIYLSSYVSHPNLPPKRKNYDQNSPKVRMLELQQVEQHQNGHRGLDSFQEKFERLMSHVSSVVVISDDKLKLALLGLFAQGHLLLEDLPGVGKTLLAKTISFSLDGVFSRIQFTPDLLPSDITGSSVFDLRKQTFEYLPGPIFGNVVVADELNRAGPRTQSALLEAMAEGQVSADGKVRLLPRPFFTIATQNLVETHGTFPLPNSQLDRFLVSMALGLPTPDQEMEILSRWEQGHSQASPVLTTQEVAAMQDSIRTVAVAHSVKQYIVNLTAASRQQSQFTLGVSPRGSAAMLRVCQAWAAFDGRDFVVPEDIQYLAPHVWGHRVGVRGDVEMGSGRHAITELLRSVPIPL